MTGDVLDTITPEQWAALAAAARRDAARLPAEAVGNFMYTVAADATGARYWFEARAERAVAARALHLAHAAGVYDNRTAGPDQTLREQLTALGTAHDPLDMAARFVGPQFVEEARNG
ncbi:hypothetical protein SCMU_13990 [Sinomonas cyclohexanicum]|uniref:Uncharacterized protein n=1 Tax=Sinomonas cyclohexanicum TaxID=322009 RepID=A0ABM7PTI2_SINCY|nr:hypothetical protein SCMU_13990 [Corynebacterium cyclohexanicum]